MKRNSFSYYTAIIPFNDISIKVISNSVLLILATSEDFSEDMSTPSVAQTVQEANKYLQAEENFKTMKKNIYEENLETIYLM